MHGAVDLHALRGQVLAVLRKFDLFAMKSTGVLMSDHERSGRARSRSSTVSATRR